MIGIKPWWAFRRQTYETGGKQMIGIALTQNDCYCCLTDFYKAVARMADISISSNTCFDCRKICVTKDVQDMLERYYREEEKMSKVTISMVFLNYGPKASLERDGYFAEFEKGFVIKEERWLEELYN